MKSARPMSLSIFGSGGSGGNSLFGSSGSSSLSAQQVMVLKNARFAMSEVKFTSLASEVIINKDKYGSHTFIVYPKKIGGPRSHFMINKTSADGNITLNNVSSSTGIDGATFLTTEWDNYIVLSKSSHSYDGTYVVLTLVSTGLDEDLSI